MLAHDIVGEQTAARTAVFLHGILGSKNNWKSFCKRLLEHTPGLRCVLVDLRGHGRSHGSAPPHTLAACADDVLALGFTADVIVGHSFGGKVALEIATRAPAGLRDVAVLDVPPGLRVFGSGESEIERVIAGVRAVPMPIASRRALEDDLRGRGLSEPLARWMTTNLVPVAEAGDALGPLRWTFDLAVIDALLASFAAADYWPFLAAHQGAPRIHMVRAERGARYSAGDIARLDDIAARGAVTHRVLADAGHWLHTDNPAGLAALLAPILNGGPA